VLFILKNIKITNYFLGASVAFWAAFALLAGVSWQGLSSGANSLHEVHSVRMNKVNHLAGMLQNITLNRTEILLMFQHDAEGKLHGIHDHALSMHLDNYDQRRAKTNELWGEVKAMPVDDKEGALIKAVDEARAAWVGTANDALSAVKQNRFTPEVMSAYLKAGRVEGEAMRVAINELYTYQEAAASVAATEADARHQRAMISFVVLALGMGLPGTVVTI
jgi:methyl-accepting chemotaxis protein